MIERDNIIIKFIIVILRFIIVILRFIKNLSKKLEDRKDNIKYSFPLIDFKCFYETRLYNILNR